MNRLPRGIYGNGFFHVMVQGINKEYIFEKQEYKNMYLTLILSHRKKFKVTLVAYCIMDNHAHLIIYTDDVYEMSAYMKIINSKFAKYYNSQNNRVGYVFRDRFNSQYINDNEYLLRCLNYIHMNPVNANMVIKPDYYIYSSYNDYLNRSNIVTEKVIKKVFGKIEGYLDIFLNISNKELEIMDVDRENKNFEIATILYFEKMNTTVEELKKDKNKLIDFCNEIIIKKNYKQKQVSKLLKISETKISKILNQVKRKKSV